MSAKDIVTVKNKKYKLVAPDGGYGYFIFISVIICFGTTTAFLGCFGIIFDDFIKEIGMSSTNVTLVTGINSLCLAIGGFLTSSMLKLVSMRKLAFIAAVIFNLGIFGNVFVYSDIPFYICQGAMQGFGMGVLYNLACTILNDYFVTRRIFAVSFVQTISAICNMLAPMFVKWCYSEFGYRGTLLIISGLSMQNFIAVALMQPVQWHMKRIEIIDDNEMQILLMEEKKEKEAEESKVPTVKLTDVEVPAAMQEEKVYDFNLATKNKSIFMRILESLVDVSVSKKLLLSCVSHGIALSIFTDSTYSLILPQALYAEGWSQYNVALAISISAFGDLTTRTLLIFTSKWQAKIGNQEMYVIGLALACLSRLAIMWSPNTYLTYVCLGMMGVSRCTVSVLVPLVLSDVVTADQFTSAMGTILLLIGVTCLILGPVVGAIRDLTNSYSVAFYILSSLFAIIALFWSIELCYKKNKHKRVQRENSLKSSRPRK